MWCFCYHIFVGNNSKLICNSLHKLPTRHFKALQAPTFDLYGAIWKMSRLHLNLRQYLGIWLMYVKHEIEYKSNLSPSVCPKSQMSIESLVPRVYISKTRSHSENSFNLLCNLMPTSGYQWNFPYMWFICTAYVVKC